ncbi:hypothetical protein BOTBODRAFT_189826 [Botryobasidium botryosum FD-172 SS1]|uniref:Uncharacterized protein n=1 Tax=Botryobasidium botryosum (strain FD-172 SS1) TaxID=930990 RepID=A0A067M9S4_BOTB1|nr:hypothetical protein BOTBODRAFT_189826 [Botryobasidium botryosum FD-172 SS1]
MPYERYLTGPRPTYEPFSPLPEAAQAVTARPIKNGAYSFSSSGLSVMGYLPKRPRELLSTMSEQYEEPELDRCGRERRGGPGKKKTEVFFQAHLTWYGIEYHPSDNREQLENRLWETLSTLPPPALSPHIYEIEAQMRQQWLDETSLEQARMIQILTDQGYTVHNSDLLAQLTGHAALTDEFFTDRAGFFRTHFPPDAAHDYVVVLASFDEDAEGLIEWACDVYNMQAERVNKGVGRGARFPDYVVGRSRAAVQDKAEEIRREVVRGRNLGSRRFGAV